MSIDSIMKKTLKIVLWSLVGITIVAIVGTGILFGPFVKAALSVEKLDDDLYYMEYHGDDGFDQLIKQGGIRNSAELRTYLISFLSRGFAEDDSQESFSANYGCSAITTRSKDGRVLMGRNFDFSYGTGIIFHSYPDDGYESITTFNSDFYGFGDNWVPEGFVNQYMAVSGLMLALDGINEKGLAMADLMAGDDVETHQSTGKPSLTTTAAIKYILNKAADVDEALELLHSIDMHSDIGSAHHYAISDATGKSVVVEYVDGNMVIVDSPVLANHYLCEEKFNVGLEDGDNRYDILCKKYNEAGGTMDKEQITEAIESVSKPKTEEHSGTVWTMVMDLKEPCVTYYSRRHFENPFTFKLDSK